MSGKASTKAPFKPQKLHDDDADPDTSSKNTKKSRYSEATDGDVLSFIDNTIQDDMGNLLSVATANQTHLFGAMPAKKKAKAGTFQAMDLVPEVLDGIRRLGFRQPTPIQRKSIPPLLEGHDVVAMARTGSGKTAAFAIPLLNRLASKKVDISLAPGVRAVVLSPTRELAQQTFKVISQLSRGLKYRIVMLIGGQAMSSQFELLSNSPDILIATPGRLVHHLIEVQFSLQSVEFCCFDEADRLFEMGFAQQLYEILRRMNENRQTCLFSATMPKALIEFSRAGLKNPISIRLDSKLSNDLAVSFFTLSTKDKPAFFLYCINQLIPQNEQCIVFVSTRHHVELLMEVCEADSITVTGVHGQMDTEARTDNISLFKNKKARVMIVTDLAARGIDIPLLDNVLNYDFPSTPKLFVHRSGRVARAGNKGTSYNMVTFQDMPYLIDLYLFFGWKFPLLNQQGKSVTPDRSSGSTSSSSSSNDNNTDDDKIDPNDIDSINRKFADDNDDDDNKLDLVRQRKAQLQALADNDDDNDGDNKEITAEQAEEAAANRIIELGAVPKPLLDYELEHYNTLVYQHDLQRFINVANNATIKYTQTREKPSAASVRRFKEVDEPDIHPYFYRRAESDAANGKNDLKNIISTVKMQKILNRVNLSQTIFELNNTHKDVIGKKRQLHDMIIRQTEAQRDGLLTSNISAFEEQHGSKSNTNDNDDTSKLSTQSSTVIIKRAIETTPHIQITAADRRKKKRLQDKFKEGKITKDELDIQLKQLDNDIKSQNGTLSNTIADAVDGELEITNMGPTRKKKRGQMTSDERRDQHFISLTQSDRNIHEEIGLAIKGNLNDMALELNAEDAEGARSQRKLRKWSERSKRFITVFESKDAFGKLVTNESGQKVSKDYVPGQLYNEWQKKSKRNAVAEVDTDNIGNNKTMSAKQSRDFARMKKDNQRELSKAGKQRPKDEIKTHDELIKQKKESAKNKSTFQRGSGGGRGGGSRGGSQGGGRSGRR